MYLSKTAGKVTKSSKTSTSEIFTNSKKCSMIVKASLKNLYQSFRSHLKLLPKEHRLKRKRKKTRRSESKRITNN
jgi:hypothetical protein